MANFAYIVRIDPPLTKEAFRTLTEAAVREVLGERWVVVKTPWDNDGYTLSVEIPGTEKYVDEYWGIANKGNPPENVGFCLALTNSRKIAFRHQSAMQLARWAQGCVEEELSERLGAPLYYDAGPTTYPPGRREYRRGKTMREYLLRNFGGKVEDAEHEASLQRMMHGTPPGFDQ